MKPTKRAPAAWASGRSARQPARAGYSIGGLATATGLEVSTIRFYERRGLLRPADRQANRYRVYDAKASERLQVIRAAQEAGFTLRDIARLLALPEGDAAACGEVRALLRSRLHQADDELRRLLHTRRVLRRFAAACHRTGSTAPCPSLRILKRPPRGRDQRSTNDG